LDIHGPNELQVFPGRLPKNFFRVSWPADASPPATDWETGADRHFMAVQVGLN
jgi:hypothetical protein